MTDFMYYRWSQEIISFLQANINPRLVDDVPALDIYHERRPGIRSRASEGQEKNQESTIAKLTVKLKELKELIAVVVAIVALISGYNIIPGLIGSKPDLIIESVSHDNVQGRIVFIVKIKNDGGKEASRFTLFGSIDGGSLENSIERRVEIDEELSPGETYMVHEFVVPNSAPAGNYALSVSIDHYNIVSESDENNNEYEYNFIVN